ncbi:MAG: MATE family efflux transporter [Oscillospiraceae bacterium]|nr:MATE family efflux transporter [Oscillospiraceae bacterium]
MEKITKNDNPLGHEKPGKLLLRFAVPSVISMLIGALYNIIDQIFIGQSVGYLGNAATNIDFPITIATLALALAFGIGSTANFSLALGAGDKDRAAKYIGNAVFWIAVIGVLLVLGVRIFLKPLLLLLGATDEVLPYAMEYGGIMAFGLCFAMLSAGLSYAIRADGRPKLSMFIMITGCVLNVILDAVFIFGFKMGMTGAALASIIGQFVSASMALFFILHMKQVKLTPRCFLPAIKTTLEILKLGIAPFINHISSTVVLVAMNNSLKHYGAQSVYGAEIPIAVSGVIMKTNMLFFSVVIGISQGCQPIIGFNYGAKKYDRVSQTLKLGLLAATSVSVISFLCYQIFPRQLISIFGSGDELYFEFAVRYYRIFLMFAFINGIQPFCGNFFTSIGKAVKGVFIIATRQLICLVPLLLLLPLIFGIDGILYAGPIADAVAMSLAILFVSLELRHMKQHTPHPEQ